MTYLRHLDSDRLIFGILSSRQGQSEYSFLQYHEVFRVHCKSRRIILDLNPEIKVEGPPIILHSPFDEGDA